MKKLGIILFSIALIIAVNGCKKKTSPANTYPYNVKMTDAPGPYSAVYVDIKGVEVTGTDGKIVILNVNSGVYNLLNFSNGVDTLIATATLDISAVEQIRLILGSNNTVLLNGVSYPLATPSAEQSGLKLQVHQTLEAGVQNYVLLDFDANKSIIQLGNGSFKLKPVIRTIETPISGAIKGAITPVGVLANVTATSSTGLTYSSNVNSLGGFMLMGLPAGTYSVTVNAAAPLNPVTKDNIVVVVGTTTNVSIAL